ncbi:MAG: BolA family protein [Pseudomonadota bacterium]|nr:BolA family protein [Pseudomonadota bacterium]
MGHSSDLKAKLEAAFSPRMLEIIDESHLHAGHAESFDGTGETHLRVRIVADAFAGMSRIERHRAINALAADEIDAGLHALAIDAKAPTEAP